MKEDKNPIQPKLREMNTSVFAVMSQMAADYDAINLSQGFPDFQISGELIDRVNYHMKEGRNQYAPMKGVPGLRDMIQKLYLMNHNADYDAEDEITVTAGATQALYTAISAFVRKGDEVIIFEPAYDAYAPAIQMNGGIVKYSRLREPGFHVEWDEVARIINPKTRMIIINSPHNPTGAVFSEQDMLQLQKLVKEKDLVVISDEVYEHLVFDGQEHHSAARFKELAQKTFVIGSFGKTLHATGWKTGYALAPAPLMKEFRKMHQFVVFAVNTPVQYAITDYLKKYPKLEGLADFYQAKRDFFVNQIQDSRFKVIPSKGTYFQLLDYRGITQKDDQSFTEELIKNYGIAAIPLTPFYHEKQDNMNILRFCFAKKQETINKAAEVLCRI
ncbi:MAG: aminotransferase class I/II-fold pyridoxal phosphate-dependent enzyme [Bacteroidales bacterium]|nr:aminotransferase class I/II-fold pyridoxal phosphate-dependent enzyme [Bacteroidales bacterium]MCF8336991.1 aminotransferase class I/II-fold pyridoxal phosphate-dependent enzyme [Bacteroidales bacterium]